MAQTSEDRKKVMHEWRKNNPEKWKAIHKRAWKKKQAKKVAFCKAHPELYHQTPKGLWTKNVPEELKERRRLKWLKWNAIWQKGKGREAHNRAAREYKRRKTKLKLLKK